MKYSPLLCFQPDIVHLVTSFQYSLFAPWLHTTKYKSIVSFRGYDIVVKPWTDNLWMETLQGLFKKVDILHFVSNYLRDEAIKIGAPESKCRVIYPSSNISNYPDAKHTPLLSQRLKI